jgi:orotate phosphoribosyltransferase
MVTIVPGANQALVPASGLAVARQTVIELVQLQQARQQLAELGVVRHGHFRHRKFSVPPRCSTVWADAHPLWSEPFATSSILQAITERLPFKDEVDFVCGPPTGGYAMARDIARLISSGRELGKPTVMCAPINKTSDGYQLDPYYRRRLQYRRVILVDDVRWYGDTFNACGGELLGAQAHILAAVFIVDFRFPTRPQDRDLPIYALQRADPGQVYNRSDCPHCKAGEGFTEL